MTVFALTTCPRFYDRKGRIVLGPEDEEGTVEEVLFGIVGSGHFRSDLDVWSYLNAAVQPNFKSSWATGPQGPLILWSHLGKRYTTHIFPLSAPAMGFSEIQHPGAGLAAWAKFQKQMDAVAAPRSEQGLLAL